MCKLRIPVDPEDKEIEFTVDKDAGKARVTVLRQTGENHVVEIDLASGEQRAVAA